MMSNDEILANKRDIISLLQSTCRNNIKNVLDYFDKVNFYEAPSSLNRHHNWRGGLAEHCVGVYKIAIQLNTGVAEESIIIAALLHDICKASKLYYGEDGQVHRRDTHIKGHGYRSIKLLKKLGLDLTEDEKLAIRWHMGGHHASEDEREEVEKARNSELWKIIHRADKLDASGNRAILIDGV